MTKAQPDSNAIRTPEPACCKSTTLRTCCGAETKASCRGPEKAPEALRLRRESWQTDWLR